MNSPAENYGISGALHQRLLLELETLHLKLAQLNAKPLRPQNEARQPVLAVARLVYGMDMRAWEQLRQTLELSGWCALEVCQQVSPARLCSPHLADCENCTPDEDILTGALLAAPLLQQIHKEVTRAQRGQSPLSLVALSSAPRPEDEPSRQAAMLILAEAARRHMLNCDSLGCLDSATLLLVLPGAGLFKAQALAEAILAECPTAAERNFYAGVAGAKAQCETSTLLQQSLSALHEARQQGQSLRVYREAAHPLSERRTLVRSDEKRFLFSGGDQ